MRQTTFKTKLMTGFTIGLLTASVSAQSLVTSATAQRVVQTKGTVDLNGETIRCEGQKRVGLWVQSTGPVTVTNGKIVGCKVGVVAKSKKGAPVSLTQLTVDATQFGMWLQGSPGGRITDNTVRAGESAYHITGSHYALSNNQ